MPFRWVELRFPSSPADTDILGGVAGNKGKCNPIDLCTWLEPILKQRTKQPRCRHPNFLLLLGYLSPCLSSKSTSRRKFEVLMKQSHFLIFFVPDLVRGARRHSPSLECFLKAMLECFLTAFSVLAALIRRPPFLALLPVLQRRPRSAPRQTRGPHRSALSAPHHVDTSHPPVLQRPFSARERAAPFAPAPG